MIRAIAACGLAFCLAGPVGADDRVLPAPDVLLKRRGVVYAVARQPDGGVLIGGHFTSISGWPRRHLARLRPDGTLDPEWRADAEGPIWGLAVDDAGDAFVSGEFASIEGTARAGLAKIGGSGTGKVDSAWDPALNIWPVGGIALAPGDGLFVSGGCSGMLEPYRPCILAKVETNGAGRIDPAWHPAPSGWVGAMVPDGQGHLFVSGAFESIGGLRRSGLAKLSTVGTGRADSDWQPVLAGRPGVLAHRGNAIYLSTEVSVGESWRTSLHKIGVAAGAVPDPDWSSADIDGRVLALQPGGDGQLYAGGFSRTANGGYVGWMSRFSAASGQREAAWNPAINGAVSEIWFDDSARLHVAGGFTRVGSDLRLGMAMLRPDGGADRSLDVEVAASARVLAAQPDGGMIVAGNFLTAQGLPRSGLLRLAPDGALDPDWDPSPDGPVDAIAADPQGDVYVGGNFSRIGGQPRARIAKLQGAGRGDATLQWDAGADGPVREIELGTEALYVAGEFTRIGGILAEGLVRLALDGRGDPRWLPDPNRGVSAMLAHEGALYVAGPFTSIGGAERKHLAKIDGSRSGAADPLWDPTAGDETFNYGYAIMDWELGPDRTVYAAGFDARGSQLPFVGRFALDGAGTPAPDWNNPWVAEFGVVYSIELAADGKLYVAGDFPRVGGVPRHAVARLDAATGALDPGWGVPLSGWSGDAWPSVLAVESRASSGIVIAGTFGSAERQARDGLAALAFQSGHVFSDGLESW